VAKTAISVAPSGRVVSIGEIKDNSRIDTNELDAMIAAWSDAGEDMAEDYTWRKFLTQTWIQYYDNFEDPLILAHSPVQSITSISYTDSNGDSQTLSTSVYELGKKYGYDVVRRKYNQDWPTPRSHEDVVAVTYVVGYGAASVVPQRIKDAIMLYADLRYNNRGDESLPRAFYDLLYPFRLARPQAIGAKA